MSNYFIKVNMKTEKLIEQCGNNVKINIIQLYDIIVFKICLCYYDNLRLVRNAFRGGSIRIHK